MPHGKRFAMPTPSYSRDPASIGLPDIGLEIRSRVNSESQSGREPMRDQGLSQPEPAWSDVVAATLRTSIFYIAQTVVRSSSVTTFVAPTTNSTSDTAIARDVMRKSSFHLRRTPIVSEVCSVTCSMGTRGAVTQKRWDRCAAT